MNNEFHQSQNYQKFNEYQFINNMFFGAKKTETIKVDNTSVKDLELVTKMSQEFAKTLDLKETLNNALELLISDENLIKKLAENAVTFADSNFSEHKSLSRLRSCIEEII